MPDPHFANTPAYFKEVSTGATPSSGQVALYAKTDGLFYSKDDTGIELPLGGGGGSGAYLPLSGGTVTGVLSTTNVIYASGGNSNQWNSTYSTVQSNSASWGTSDRLNNGTVQVVLSSDNNLHFPTGTIGDTLLDGGFTIVGKPGSYAELASYDGNVFAWASDTNYGNPVGGGFSIGTDTTTASAGYVWTFGNNGLLRFPDGTTQSTAFTDSLAALNDVSIPTPVNGQVLTYNSITNKWNAGTPLSASGATGYYGSFYDTTVQTLTSTTQAKRINIAQTYEHNGVSIDNNRIVFNYNGVYELIYSIQYKNTSNAQQDIYIWFKQNGVDIPNSSSVFTIPAHKNPSIPAQLIAVSPFMSTLTAGDFIELYWHCNSTSVTVETFTTHANPTIPDTPGVIVTVKQVTNVQIVPTVGAYLPLSGGTLTGVVSTTNVLYTTGGNSDQWNNTYSTVQTNSGSWNAAGRYLPLSGGTLTGALSVTNLSAFGNINAPVIYAERFSKNPQNTSNVSFDSFNNIQIVYAGVLVGDNNGDSSNWRWSSKNRSTYILNEGVYTAGVVSINTALLRGAANTLEQRNDVNPQAFYTYNTSTSANLTYERGFSRWSSNVFQIGTEKLGAGVARALDFVVGGTRAGGINSSGNADFKGVTVTNLFVAYNESIKFGNSVWLSSPSLLGVLTLSDATGNWDRLQFGGTTSAFPALKRSGTTLQARLADDSAFTNVACANLSATNVVYASGGNSNQWNSTYSTVQTSSASWGGGAAVEDANNIIGLSMFL